MNITKVRLGLSLGGMVVAVLAIMLEDRRFVWGAIALLAASLLLRVLGGRRRGRNGEDGAL